MSIDYRPNDPSVLADPFPLYRRMRDEDPAHWSPVLKAWVLTRYEDVKRVCLDSRVSSDRLRPFFATLTSGEAEHITQLMRVLTLRSEEHTSELQSLAYLVCRLLLEKKKNK